VEAGDEFAVLLYGLQCPADAEKVAQAIISRLVEPLELNGHTLYVTASIGVSFFPNDGADPDQLTRRADIAMYQAKQSGRNDYRFYDVSMDAHSLELMELEADLRTALANDEFRVYYQPQVNLETGHVIAMEALLRWLHPRRGIISPRQFIPIAEESRLILPIGEWVLRQACNQARRWQEAGLPAIRIAVNFTSLQFRQTDAAHRVARILAETGLDPVYLELEMTEDVVMQDERLAEVAARGMADLKALGVHVSVDDFGTGYSGLGHLKKFPIEKLKIDQSFVDGLPDDEHDVAFVSAIIGLSENLGISALAEGVETQEQLECLRTLGCDHAQGFLIGRPAPAGEATEMLANGMKVAA